MEKIKLCVYCINDNERQCEFIELADEVADSVQRGASLDRIHNASKEIARLRVIARDDKLCPNNTHEPIYRGRERL